MKLKTNVINICSSSSYHGGEEGHTVYSATKHALLGFSRALTKIRKLNIRVSSISPADTEMMKKIKKLKRYQ